MKLAELFEARYAGKKPTTEDVYEYFKDLAERLEHLWSESPGEEDFGVPYSVSHPLGIKASSHSKYKGGSYAILSLWFHFDIPEAKAEEWAKGFVRKYNIPYTEINAPGPPIEFEETDPPKFLYEVWIIYDPDKFKP
jgi:hypothetical protein